MPIYEFYCADCHTIFSFLSRSPDTSRRPDCPRCGKRKLERRASAFAISKGRPEPAGEDGLPDLDDTKMERAMAELAREAEGMADDDPRQIARLMRKLYDSSGVGLGQGMEEALRRMEAGEDPDKIEEEMGDVFDEEDPFAFESEGGLRGISQRLRPPEVDDTLYDLE